MSAYEVVHTLQGSERDEVCFEEVLDLRGGGFGLVGGGDPSSDEGAFGLELLLARVEVDVLLPL